MKFLACFLIAALAGSSSIAKEKPPIIETRDAVYQTVWYAPQDRKATVVNAGLLKMDTYQWRVYPMIGRTFSGDRKEFVLVVEMTGPVMFTNAQLVLTVDSEVVEIPYQDWSSSPWLFGEHTQVLKIRVLDSLIRHMAAANYVLVTIPLDQGRCTVKLTPRQAAAFQLMIEKFDSLR